MDTKWVKVLEWVCSLLWLWWRYKTSNSDDRTTMLDFCKWAVVHLTSCSGYHAHNDINWQLKSRSTAITVKMSFETWHQSSISYLLKMYMYNDTPTLNMTAGCILYRWACMHTYTVNHPILKYMTINRPICTNVHSNVMLIMYTNITRQSGIHKPCKCKTKPSTTSSNYTHMTA